MPKLFALLAGVIFGFGLILSGMNDPAKVLGFLDLAGQWDPSLGLVMAGAIGVSVWPFWVGRRRKESYLGLPIDQPVTHRIDLSLLSGSAIFGVGWGLSGICPGPAIVSLGAAYWPGVVFLIAMLLGMTIYQLLPSRRSGEDYTTSALASARDQ